MQDGFDTVPTRFQILGAISFSHFLNDMIQSLIVAIYPLLKSGFALSFVQIGAITLTYQICASVLQPLIGAYTDKHPKPHSLSAGMGFTLIGLVTLALAPNYSSVLVAAAFVGTGSAIFHPESSRIARLASGGRHGMAQSIFQVGGSAGSALGPLLAGVDHHAERAARASPGSRVAAILAIVVLWNVSGWYARRHLSARPARRRPASSAPCRAAGSHGPCSSWWCSMFSKYFYLASISSYYSFYLIDKFRISVAASPNISVSFPVRSRGRLVHRRTRSAIASDASG